MSFSQLRSKNFSFDRLFPSPGGGSQQFTQDVGSTLTFSGLSLKFITDSFASVLSFVGTFSKTRVTVVLLTAVLSFSGLIKKSVFKVLSATVTATASLLKKTFRSYLAVLSSVGSLLKQDQKKTLSTVSLLGGLKNLPLKGVFSSISFANTLTKRTALAKTALVTFSGFVSRGRFLIIHGTIGLTSTLTHAYTALALALESIYTAQRYRVSRMVGITYRTTQEQVRSARSRLSRLINISWRS